MRKVIFLLSFMICGKPGAAENVSGLVEMINERGIYMNMKGGDLIKSLTKNGNEYECKNATENKGCIEYTSYISGGMYAVFKLDEKDRLVEVGVENYKRDKFEYETSKDIDTQLEECGTYSNPDFIEECAYKAYKMADVQLNEKYQEILRNINRGNIKEEFKKSQRKWVSFRDADCKVIDPRLDSDNRKSGGYMCLSKKTLVRVREFEEILGWPIGCNGCPL